MTRLSVRTSRNLRTRSHSVINRQGRWTIIIWRVSATSLRIHLTTVCSIQYRAFKPTSMLLILPCPTCPACSIRVFRSSQSSRTSSTFRPLQRQSQALVRTQRMNQESKLASQSISLLTSKTILITSRHWIWVLTKWSLATTLWAHSHDREMLSVRTQRWSMSISTWSTRKSSQTMIFIQVRGRGRARTWGFQRSNRATLSTTIDQYRAITCHRSLHPQPITVTTAVLFWTSQSTAADSATARLQTVKASKQWQAPSTNLQIWHPCNRIPWFNTTRTKPNRSLKWSLTFEYLT